MIGQGTSHAQITYGFRVNGPAPNLEVPIHIEGRLAVEAGNAFAPGFDATGYTIEPSEGVE